MGTETTADLASLLTQEHLDSSAFSTLKQLAMSSNESLNRFRELLSDLERKAESGAVPASRAALKIGISHLFQGNAQLAARWLEKAEESPDRALYLGLAYRDLRRYDDAITALRKAAEIGAERLLCDCLVAECHLLAGRTQQAEELLNSHQAAGRDNPQWNYTRGRSLQLQGDLESALDAYEKALQLEPTHAHASFHAAYLYDLHGNDGRALDLYTSASQSPLVHANAMMNLAVLHEDAGRMDDAANCLRRVLSTNPAHERARLFLKDVLAANDMFIDDELGGFEKRNAVLDIPVTDFELSVRSRNCLKKMNIHTLGDLLRTSEAELLSYKNFGETSLKEIKAMLTQKGLVLGQLAHEKRQHIQIPSSSIAPPAPTGSDLLSRPVSALQLSVRARKCLQGLNITTIGELTMQTENELMSSRNFGQTSLQEIKSSLAELGLGLREM